jgi:predicted ABC-type ATPase
VIVALAGSNGAGKTTFYHAHLQPSGLRLINADILARELGLDAYGAAKMAAVLRQRLVEQRESFVFETVFSDPVGDKLAFLQDAVRADYQVVLCFIGIASPETSDQRVAMRVSQGGHDVPLEKLAARFPRTLANLKTAVQVLPHVMVFDNEDLNDPFKRVAVFEHGKAAFLAKPLPRWLAPLLPPNG